MGKIVFDQEKGKTQTWRIVKLLRKLNQTWGPGLGLKTLETKFETLRESTINKLNVILENEKEFEVKTKISETIDRIKNEKFDQLNFLKLKNLENSI